MAYCTWKDLRNELLPLSPVEVPLRRFSCLAEVSHRESSGVVSLHLRVCPCPKKQNHSRESKGGGGAWRATYTGEGERVEFTS